MLEGVKRAPQWRALDDGAFADFETTARKLLAGFPINGRPNEAQTEKDLIYPVLEALGWSDVQVQETLSAKGRKQVPDALLFASAEQKTLAVAEPQPFKRYAFGLAIMEAKRWARALDRADKREAHEDGVPSTQMLQYLSRVDIQTSGVVRLGILTNGVKWRLYFQGALSVSEEYLEVDLAKALGLPGHDLDLVERADERLTPAHALKLFYLLFGKQAFLPIDGKRTFHDIARDSGKVWEEQVTRDLSTLVFGDLFPKLVSAVAKHDAQRPSPMDAQYLDDVRQSALILLYRLLFVVYAEDRDLLPDAEEPYKSYSLTAMRLDIAAQRARARVFSQSAATYWPKLLAVFKVIAEGDDSLGVPPYNGGLFAKESALILERISLPDALIADLIFGLSHRTEDGEARYINYRDLSVQQLGTVYERTLEYSLREIDGTVVVDADDAARHSSGSYYTPDSLVMLIIEKAVGPLVQERLEAFRAKSEELAKDPRPMARREALLVALDPASEILKLKICDPAMGSGHFLVSLVDWLADRVLAAIQFAEDAADWTEQVYRSPVLDNIQATRNEIKHQAGQRGWFYEPEHLDDRHIVRRTILKRCIYGVDKNPMAVELAKVALWLHTFTVGAPLSFLDHHLRCGNSLLGAWVKPAMDKMAEWGGPLLMEEPRKRAVGAASAMQAIEKLSDADIAEVTQSKNLFAGVSSMTAELTGLMDIIHAADLLAARTKDERDALDAFLRSTYGDPVELAHGKAKLALPETDPKDTGKLATKARTLSARIETSVAAMREHIALSRPFHWQVAFPGIWRDWEEEVLHGGFDAVVGNPPYVRHELIRDQKPALQKAFPATYSGTADLYVYFYEQGLKLLRPGGRMSYVVTNKWLRAGYAEKLRDHFATQGWIEFVADFGHAKHFFPDADVFPSVVVIRKPEGEAPTTSEVCVIPRDDVPQKGLDAAVTATTYKLPRAHFTNESWVLEPPDVVALMDKIKGNGVPLKEYAGVSPLYGIKTGFNEAFLIDAPTRDRLIAEDPKSAEFIKPYLRGQDVERWRAPATGLYMIVMASSGDREWPWSSALDELAAEQKFSHTFPALHRHFKRHEAALRRRQDQGRYWWELRACAYYGSFSKRKTIYVDIAWTPSMLVDDGGSMCVNTVYFLPSELLGPTVTLNSPISWWYSWRKAQHGKDEALRYFTDYVEAFPVANLEKHETGDLERLVGSVTERTAVVQSRAAEMRDWLRHTWQLEAPPVQLRNPSALDTEAFVAGVIDALPRRQKLSAADIADLKREYAATVEPARQARAEIFALERELSHLVNVAYGLTPEDVSLMWRTSPPRMPFTPSGLQDVVQPADNTGNHERE
ncbi:MAG: hypothetical protein DCF16_01620 [Alphaproteobacteria bacterium]|nr:MAG: hypothetical protein DCF16_01620 [Alphaproteobacteria bacterium]